MAQELSEETRALVRSRIPNYGVLSEREATLAAIKVIAQDFEIYCERNLVIKDKRGELVPFVLNWAQKKLVREVLDDIAHGRPVRYIILKARQMGLSTVIEALCFWWTTTHRNINSVIIAHEKKAAENLYKMFRRYYENCHPFFQAKRKYNTRTDLTFDAEDNEKRDAAEKGEPNPGLGSEIKTMVAKDGGGRSDTILFFHGSEVAFWDKGADVVSSALQAVPMLPNTFAFLESTANGVGGYFYNEWQYAKKGESTFKPFFFAWHEHPEYMLDTAPLAAYDDEELDLLEIFKEKGYPQQDWDRKIAWRRMKKKEFRSEPAKFYQEYPKDDMEAFLASGRPVFDIKKLIEMEQKALEVPFEFCLLEDYKVPGSTVAKTRFRPVPVTFQDQDPTPFKVWKLPEEGRQYVVGTDVSEGLARGANGGEGDYSVVDVMDAATQETVAKWRGHIDPDQLGDVSVQIAKFYNYALLGIEINNQGISTVQRARDLLYRNLYMRETPEDDYFQERTSKMGWRTDRKTKPVMINDLGQAIREDDIIDHDVVFVREAMTYVRDDQGRTEAQEGMFDDCVMAKAIALQMCHWKQYNLDKDRIHKPTTRRSHATNKNEIADIAAAGHGYAKRGRRAIRHRRTVGRRR